MLNSNILPYLSTLLNHQKKLFRKESCWAISNILAGNYGQIQVVLDEQNILKKLIYLIYNDDSDVMVSNNSFHKV